MSRIVRVNADAKPRCIEIGREALSEINPGALLADGLEDAFVGYTLNTHHAHVAVYDYGACVEILVGRDGMSHEDAVEFLDFNTLGAYVGENGPLFVSFLGDPE